MLRLPVSLFHELLPRAVAWAEAQERIILDHKDSVALSAAEQAIAFRAGVQRPDAVRILAVVSVPFPDEADLRAAGQMIGLVGEHTAGLTIGHGIFLRRDHWKDAKLIAHELVHVAQYERYGRHFWNDTFPK